MEKEKPGDITINTLKKEIKVRIYRYDPEKNIEYYQIFKIPKEMKVIDIIEYINKKYNTNIAIRYYCKIGKCRACYVLLNNKLVLSCQTFVTEDSIIKPYKKAIRDLVV